MRHLPHFLAAILGKGAMQNKKKLSDMEQKTVVAIPGLNSIGGLKRVTEHVLGCHL